jgi:hypothetical protein
MNNPPIIDIKYLASALSLRTTQLIADMEISQVIESNTALVIKIKILIKETGHIDSTRQLFIKTIKYNPKTNTYHNLSLKEANFYKFIQSETNVKLPIAQCYDAYISDDKFKYLLLLEDLSNEFHASDKINLSDENIWLSAASSLAKFHAAFWNSDKIGSQELPIDNIEKINFYIKNTYESYDKFIKYVGNRFDAETLAIFEHAMKISVGLETERYNRLTNKDNITLTHGDSHIYNFMFPRNQEETSVIIDFQFWGMGIGVKDIAHLTRESFPKVNGEKLHLSIIKKYYETLLEQGVCNYSWDNCWNDYRKQVASMLLIPIWQYTHFNLEYDNWIKDVPSLISNYKLLNCDQLEVESI